MGYNIVIPNISARRKSSTMRSVARKFASVLTFLPVLVLLLGLIQGPTAKAQEYPEGYPLTGATFSSGPVSVTAWGFRSEILFVDMDVRVEKSAAVWVQTGQPEGCLAETTSVASGALLSGKPLTWLPVKSECFAEPVRFLLEGAGDIHLSFQADSFYSVTVWWVSEGVSGTIPVYKEDFSWLPPSPNPAPPSVRSDRVQTTPTPASVTVDVKNPRVWVENGPEEATYRVWWDCGTGPRIVAVEIYETRPYRGPSELPIPFEAGWVSITWDSPGHLLACRDSQPVYSTSLVSRWVVVYALLEDGVLIVSEPFLFEPRAPEATPTKVPFYPPMPTAPQPTPTKVPFVAPTERPDLVRPTIPAP